MARIKRMDFKTISGNTDKLSDLIADLKSIKTKLEENIKTDYKIKEDSIRRLTNIIDSLTEYRKELKHRGEHMQDEAMWVNW